VKRAGRRLTYANVVSTIALFVAVGGAGAFAAGRLAPKSVGEQQLRHGAVTAEKLRKNAVIATKIKDLAVKQGKLANGAVSAAKLENGAVGTDQLALGAVGTDKLADNAVTGEKVDESSLAQVPGAAKADFATAAESANPVLFAHVNLDAGVDDANSKGIDSADVKVVNLGVYCVTVAGFSPRGAQVTVQFQIGGVGAATAYARVGGTVSCAAPGVEVETFAESKKPEKEPFYIALYK
jgi:hypothetical protein